MICDQSQSVHANMSAHGDMSVPATVRWRHQRSNHSDESDTFALADTLPIFLHTTKVKVGPMFTSELPLLRRGSRAGTCYFETPTIAFSMKGSVIADQNITRSPKHTIGLSYHLLSNEKQKAAANSMLSAHITKTIPQRPESDSRFQPSFESDTDRDRCKLTNNTATNYEYMTVLSWW